MAWSLGKNHLAGLGLGHDVRTLAVSSGRHSCVGTGCVGICGVGVGAVGVRRVRGPCVGSAGGRDIADQGGSVHNLIRSLLIHLLRWRSRIDDDWSWSRSSHRNRRRRGCGSRPSRRRWRRGLSGHRRGRGRRCGECDLWLLGRIDYDFLMAFFDEVARRGPGCRHLVIRCYRQSSAFHRREASQPGNRGLTFVVIFAQLQEVVNVVLA